CKQRFPDKKYKPTIVPAVSGGRRAFQGEFPHMAAIGWTRTDAPIAYLCGGSLITWKFVLTAAHCSADIDNIPPDTVRLADTDLASTSDDEFAQQIPIARIIKHPQYRWSRKYYDIAVVELEEYVKPNKAICVACLWREPNVPGDLMDVVGFGALGFGERLSSTLQKIQLQALDETICAKRLPAMRREMPEGLRDDQLCAHSATMDTCEGDSGGPLQTDRTDLLGKTYALIVGVVAFGTPCTNGSTGVYTRVSSYLDWIEEEVKESLSPEVCIEEDYCNRKMNPSVHGKVDKIWERSRVGLLWQEYETDIHQCGGLLVDYQFVTTSASCVTSSKGPPRYVALSSDSDRAAIEAVTVHPWFTKGHPYFDIAVIKLRVYANLDKIYPACIWSEEQHGDWRTPDILVGASYLEKRRDLDSTSGIWRASSLPGRVSTHGRDRVDKNRRTNRLSLWQEYETDIHQCGGLLVDYQFVITSASCVTSSKGPPRYVVLSSDSDRAAIESVTVHPWFTKGHPYFDIAVLKLRVYANLDKIYPACIWSEEQHGDWRNDSILVGASYLEKHNDLYTRKSVQYYVKGDNCSVGENVDYNDLSCISKDATLVPGICKIDHGGPVMKLFDKQQYFVHGIVSSLTQGCEGKVIFTSLAPHRQWLEKIMYKQQKDMLWM
uniref:Peptidase S1 domain-containing protein n=1 Tax=Anopheles quadriannulatus TaxID=34691 RepID=A0A182XDB3_ANOQN